MQFVPKIVLEICPKGVHGDFFFFFYNFTRANETTTTIATIIQFTF